MDSSNTSFSLETSTSSPEWIIPERINNPALYVFVLLIILLGVCGNGFVIFIYLRSKVLRSSLQKTSMKVILNLSLTDLLVMVCLEFLCILDMLDVKLSYYVCLITFPVSIHLTFVTQCVLLVTTLDRYLAICKQQRYSKLMTTRSLNVLLALSWLLPLLISVLPFFVFINWYYVDLCIPRYLYHTSIIIAHSVFFVIVMTITIGLYIPVLLKAREFHLKTYPAQFHGINARTTRMKAKQQAFRNSIFIGVVTFFFMICNLPFSIVKFLFGIGYDVSETTITTTIFLSVTNSVVNPFLYGFQNQLVRQETLKFLKCKCLTKGGTDQSILKTRQVQPEQHPLPLRSSEASGNQTPQNAVVGTFHGNASTKRKSTGLTKPRVINVKPYQHPITAETSL